MMNVSKAAAGLRQQWQRGGEAVQGFADRLRYLVKPFWILSLVYWLAISAIVRADFYYVDDLDRAAHGSRRFLNFSRYVSEYLSPILHNHPYLTDISPLTQMLAVLGIAAASCGILHIFCKNGKIGFWQMAAVLPLGLCPYYLECFSYKYDSPYIAFSVLCMVFPFLFLGFSRAGYLISTFACTLLMCGSYQASAGIYPILVMFLALDWWNQKRDGKTILQFVGISAAVYSAAMLLFKIFLVRPINIYVGTETFPANQLFSGSLGNLKQYYQHVLEDFRGTWLLLIAVVAAGFVVLAAVRSKRSKLASLVLAVAAVLVGWVIAFGPYIALANTSFYPRAMYGLGALVAILAVQCCFMEKTGVLRLSCALLAWCFISFSFTYGNALKEQKRWTDLRVEMVIQDLNQLEVMNSPEIKTVEIYGDIGKSPILMNQPLSYAMLHRLVPTTFAGGSWIWSSTYFREYFGLHNIQAPPEGVELADRDLPVVVDNQYHIISADGNDILITLKK